MNYIILDDNKGLRILDNGYCVCVQCSFQCDPHYVVRP